MLSLITSTKGKRVFQTGRELAAIIADYVCSAGLLILRGKNWEVMRHFQCKLCSKKSLLCKVVHIMQFFQRSFHIVIPGVRRGKSLLCSSTDSWSVKEHLSIYLIIKINR